jgi:mannitol/fructose-specific phosphotransferase system IIA component (Ntr-type)
MSTGLQYGVAIPHGKTDAVDRLVCCVGVAPDGVEFDSMDGQPSRIFILTLSPKSKPAPHLQFMSTVSRVLNDAGRTRVLAARTTREVLDAFTRPAPAAPAPAAKPMPTSLALADYIRPECLQPRLRATTKEEVIRELVDLLVHAGCVSDAPAALHAVLDREGQLSTGMTDGIAIPHGRTDAVDRMACAVGVKPEGLDFDSVDGEPTRIFVLVLTTPAGAEPYLQFVASVMGALTDAGRQRVLAARTAEELSAALTGT